MANFAPSWPGDFEAVARQYWNLWGDALRGAAGPGAQAPGWQQAVDWWSRLVPGGSGQVEDAVQRFQRQASDWFGQMQQVAARFAGRDASAADIGRAWREALGMGEPQAAANPFADLFRAMQGSGAHGLDGWMEQAKPYLDAMQREGNRWLHLPTFGLSREHQERWQRLAQAQQDYQHQVGEYDRLMLKVAQQAFERFERKLEGHLAPGTQLESARALFDLWIDAAEEAYAEIALSPEFRHVYGALANAQSRLRLAVQGEVEQVCALFGMPTRTEVDSAHRKIVELERQLRRMSKAAQVPAAKRAPAVRTAEAPAEEPAPVAVEAEAPAPRRAARKARPAKKKAAPARKRPARKTPRRAVRAAAAPAQRSAPVAAPPAKAPRKKAAGKPAKKAVAKSTPKAAPKATARPLRKAAAAKTPAAGRKRVPAAVAEARPQPAAARAAQAVQPARSAAVVSMKDWVARNVAAAHAPPPAVADGKREKKKAKRGKGK